MSLGTIEEAREIFSIIGTKWDRSQLHGEKYDGPMPKGWTYLGAGRSRCVFLSPTGVVYKICHYYPESEYGESSNETEHANFATIENSGRLPEKWKVPKSHLHFWQDRVKQYDYKSAGPVDKDARVVIMACEYISGPHWDHRKATEMYNVFSSVGLCDNFEGNAIQGDDGFNYIVDAAEGRLTLDEEEE